MSVPVASVRTGELVGGRYRVERVLGGGGIGFVVAATDMASNRRCAIKLLGAAAREHPSTVERFFREARAMHRLRNEHVVRVFDVGLQDDGAPYLVMEHLEGDDLSAVVQRRGALPAHEAALYLLQACEAVGEAHALGIIHRDIKPQNLFLARRADGTTIVKVLDFGFSRQIDLSSEESRLTLNDAVLGSPAYMSPEQIRSARSADARSDIWSLGVVLYQLVTGRLPFRSDDGGQMVMHVMNDAPAPPSTVRAGLPLALDAVAMRCLEKDPRRRYATTAELSAALAPFVPWYQPTTAPLRSSPAGLSLPAPSLPVPTPRSTFSITVAVAVALAVATVALAIALR